MKWNVEKALEVIEECPASRVSAMEIAAKLSGAHGKKEGAVSSGGYVGYFKEEDGENRIFLITREGEKLDDYLIKT